MKKTKEAARAPSIAQESQNSVQNKAWHDIIAKCIEAHHKKATWQEVSDFAATRGVTMSPAFVRQGCRMLFAALDAGLTLSADQAAKTFDAALPYDSTEPYEVNVSEDEVTQMYIVTGIRLQQFYQKKKVSYDAIREYYGISDEFAITAVKVNNWHSGREGSAQLKVSLKPKTMKDFDLSDVKKVTDAVQQDKPSTIIQYPAPAITTKNSKYTKRKKYLVISDAHYGQATSKAVCGVKVNREITEENLLHIVDEFVEENFGYPYEEVEIVFTGDFVHADTCSKTTTHGTPQDCDGTIHEIVAGAAKLSIEIVNQVKKLGVPIVYRFVPGNHDRILGYTVALNTEAWFHDDTQISFILNESDTDVSLYGNVIIGFAHGEFPDSRASNMFMGRYRKEYNQALYAEVILGHLHQEKTSNPTGVCKVRRVIQAGVTDEWTTGKLFNYEYIRGCQSFCYDRDFGLVSIDYHHCIH